MTQALCSQPVSVAEVNVYRWQHSPEQPQSHLQSHFSSTKRNRNRGITLSGQGWQKLMQAGALYDESGYRYTYEQLSEQSRLDERTVSRLLSCEAKVDRRTLKTFFQAFNLSLEAGDYLSPNGDDHAMTLAPHPHAVLTGETIQFEQLIEELLRLKQRLRDYDRLLHRLGLDVSHISHLLGA